MVAYALIELEVTNIDGMGPYLAAVSDTIASHGGRYLVRGGNTEVVEGGLGQYPVKVILEFPSMSAANGWYNSSEYQEILHHRTENSKCNFVWAEGA